ncbi:MAG: acyltransferase family protein [Neptuniibacter sp.]
MTKLQDPDRIYTLDNARGIGMLLIVLGHAPSVDIWLQTFVYSFHVPLFFFVSGMLISEVKLRAEFPDFLKYYSLKLIWPYAFFFMVSYVYWIFSRNIGSRADQFTSYNLYDPILGFFYASGDYLYVNVALWFFPCLFVALILFYLANLIFSKWNLVAAFFLSICFVFLYDSSLSVPFCLDNAAVALFFVCLGYFLKERAVKFFQESSAFVLIFIACSAAALLSYICLINGRVDLNGMSFGNYGALYYCSSLLGIFLVLALSRLIGKSQLLSWIATHNIFIFPLHGIFFGVITGFFVVFMGFDIGFKNESVYYSYFYSILSIVMTYFFIGGLKIMNLNGVIR